MSKSLDLIKRQHAEIIDGYLTSNIFIGVTKEELTELEDKLKDYDYWSSFVKCYGDIKAEDLRRFIHNGWAWEQSGYKKDKALEIIKVKQVNVPSFIQRNLTTYEEYQYIDDEVEQLSEVSLSKEEYDLLKEVLK